MDTDGQKIFGVLLLLFIVALGIAFDNLSLKTENAQLKEDYIKLINERAKCSPLGICIGDYVEQTNEAKRLNMTISGVVAKVINDNLIIDTSNENWQAVNELWVRHGISKCYLKISIGTNVACISKSEIGAIKKTERDTLCQQINCTDTNEYKRGITMLIIADDLIDKKIILMEQ